MQGFQMLASPVFRPERKLISRKNKNLNKKVVFAFVCNILLAQNSAALPFIESSKALLQPDNFSPTLVKDCMHVSSKPGEFLFESTGHENFKLGACGIYFIAPPTDIIELEIESIEISCQSGLVVFFDGWEMNGKIFPTNNDHPKPMKDRFLEFCSERKIVQKRLFSSQNAALVQYRVPREGENFLIRAKFFKNPEPCNMLMSETAGIFTVDNFGKRQNCTLTSLLFPANLRVLDMEVGFDGKTVQECCSGGQDFVEFGGSSDLESNALSTKEILCGCDKETIKNKGITVLCGSSTMRLISSGKTRNQISILSKPAGAEDLDMEKNLMLICPDFM